jgi:hypothetical protein
MNVVNIDTKKKIAGGQKHGDFRMEQFQEGLTLLDIYGIESVTIRSLA